MAKKNILMKSKERRNIQELAAFLRQLADRLEQNETTLQRGDEEISVEVPSRVTFKVKVKEKVKKGGTKHQLKMVLKWKDGDRTSGLLEVA
jgi:amphi-Trp domain-containing protein